MKSSTDFYGQFCYLAVSKYLTNRFLDSSVSDCRTDSLYSEDSFHLVFGIHLNYTYLNSVILTINFCNFNDNPQCGRSVR